MNRSVVLSIEMILFSSSNTILTSAEVLPGHVCQHTFQKAMALHNIVFTVVNNWLFPKLSGARNQVGESVRPKGGSRGPSNQNGCGAPGNSTQVVQVGLHPQKCFLPVLPLPLSARVRALVPTVRLTVWKKGVLTGRSAVLARWLTADLILAVFLVVTADR